eukprot:TRINITY_DN339_c0_g1_i1.p1 TRINITY_DN339_c0_g1~~TRINITY_DN339_c0_g1_i1.p1  ORF type:complete len:203 (+),score=62.43 TRINITY_DN339_c0_g1_i1:71-679(+)
MTANLLAARSLWASKEVGKVAASVAVTRLAFDGVARARAAHAASALKDYVAVPVVQGAELSMGAGAAPSFGEAFLSAIKALGGRVIGWLKAAAQLVSAHPVIAACAAVVVVAGVSYAFVKRADAVAARPAAPAVVPQPPAAGAGAGLVCPITQEPAVYPCASPTDGRVYEYAAILQWVQQQGTCPFTRQPLAAGQLIPLRLD